MISGINTSLSALQAFQKRVDVAANNIANASTPGHKKNTVALQSQQQGVSATVERGETPGPLVEEESAGGIILVEQSNVDLAEEIPNLMLGKRMYQANLKSLQTADEMFKTLLDTVG